MIKKIILGVILAFVGHRIYKFGALLGFHVTVFNHTPGPCRLIPNMDHGSEDIDIIQGDKALITTGLRFFNRNHKKFEGVKSGVELFDFNSPQNGAQSVKIEGLTDFENSDFHGVSTYENKDTGETEVYIVNHFESYSVVERFVYDYQDVVLRHKEIFGKNDPTFRLLNDLTVTGPGQFYATNTLYTRSVLEMVGQLRWGSVLYFDGKQGHVVADALFGPNGISKSPDARTIYVAAGFDHVIHTFGRAGDNTLQLEQTTPVYGTADNINVDPDTGDLWVGLHAVGHQIFAYGDDPSLPSASKVLRLKTNKGQITEITEIFSDDGNLFSGSSVGLYKKNHLFVGSIYSKALVCEVKYL